MVPEPDHPFFTVVTVTRDNMQGLLRTRTSLERQTHQDFEHVIIDGGSTDATYTWLRANIDPRTTWTSEPDEGIYDAMNKGACLGQGEYILFLNAGDEFSDQSVLDRAHHALHGSTARWAAGISRMIGQDGNPLRLHMNVPFKANRFILGIKTMPHQAIFFHQELFRELRGYDLSWGIVADQELMYRALQLDTPKSLFFLVADCETAGISASRPPQKFIDDMHHIRLAQNSPLLGIGHLDTFLSRLLLGAYLTYTRVSK